MLFLQLFLCLISLVMKGLTDEEIHQKSVGGKILIIRNQKVYDITKFAKSHPGM